MSQRRFLAATSIAISLAAASLWSSSIDYLSTPVAYDNARDGFGQTFVAETAFVAGVELYLGDPTRPGDSSVSELAGPATLVLEDISDPADPVELHRTMVLGAGETRSGITKLDFDGPVATVVGRKYFVSIETNDQYGVGVLMVHGSSYPGGAQAFTNCLSLAFPQSPCDDTRPVGAIVEASNGRDLAFRVHGPIDSSPVANAGSDFSVSEGQTMVQLNGILSADPDGDALSFYWEQIVDGTPLVPIAGAHTAQATFAAPTVAVGGETLTFRLTVSANGRSSSDSVSVSIVNVNHAPVAEAGEDKTVAEGSAVTLDGSGSFDIDLEPFSHAWQQVSGPPVTMSGGGTSAPTFTAPHVGSGGAPGVVATLTFRLTVDDGNPADSAAPGYTLANVADTVTVAVTNVNNPPTADAGPDPTVNEQGTATLNAAGSVDPDGDALTFAWLQLAGPAIVLSAANTPTPYFTAPYVPPAGADLTFVVTVDDGYGGQANGYVTVHVQNTNDPPHASGARPSVSELWPPNHRMVSVAILGVSDPNNDGLAITITGVTQDEPTNGLGDGDTAVDAVITADGTVLLRAERSGDGDGRVYRVHFTASDHEGSSSGVVVVGVPHNRKRPAIDSGSSFDSTR